MLNTVKHNPGRLASVWLLLFALASLCGGANAAEARWYKGNLHSHSLWSDGNSFPDYVVDWYKSRGYDFLALTDHNIFQEGEAWAPVVGPGQRGGRGIASVKAYERYKERLPRMVDEKTSGAQTLVRLKTFDELSKAFAEPGRFLLIPSEEITCPAPAGTKYRVHVNAINIARAIEPPRAAEDMADPNIWQANTSAELVARQSRETGRVMQANLNHPLWSHFEFDQVCKVDRHNRMEINNDDSGSSASLIVTEKLWDTVLADRIKRNLTLMQCQAVDDCHNHLTDGTQAYGAGHGWIMVRAESLTPESLIAAMEAGDFYATRGPVLTDIKNDARECSLRIQPKQGVTYRTEFIGQRQGGQPGEVLAVSDSLSPVYKVKGDELYVRAKVTSSKARMNGGAQPQYLEMAWTQPYRPQQGR